MSSATNLGGVPVQMRDTGNGVLIEIEDDQPQNNIHNVNAPNKSVIQIGLRQPLVSHPVPQLRHPTPQGRQNVTQVRQTTPPMRQTTPQIRHTTPHIRQTTPQIRQTTPQIRQTTPQIRQTTPQIRQTTPQIRQTTPQIRQTTPQIRQNVPQIRQTVPQIRQTVPQMRQPAMGQKQRQNQSRNNSGIAGQLIQVDKKWMQLNPLIYESGKELLEEITERVEQKLEVQPYSTAHHLERLCILYPDLKQYDPKMMSERITSYMRWAKNEVGITMETGQGELGEEVVSQEATPEQKIVCLLHEANKKTGHVTAGSSRGKKNEKNVPSRRLLDSIEEKPTCGICYEADKNNKPLITTDFGEVCSKCMKEQAGWLNDDEIDEPAGEDELEREARIQQNQSLMEMEMPGSGVHKSSSKKNQKQDKSSSGSSGSSGKSVRSKRKHNYSFEEDETGDNLSKILEKQLEQDRADRMEKIKIEKEKLQIEKAEREERLKRERENAERAQRAEMEERAEREERMKREREQADEERERKNRLGKLEEEKERLAILKLQLEIEQMKKSKGSG